MERLGLLGEENAVVVSPTSRMPGTRQSMETKARQVAAHKRFAARQANLVDAKRRRHLHEARDLLKAEQLLLVEKVTSSGMQ